jgi:16S rRNA (uracil1498-N3)-methyltransferase
MAEAKIRLYVDPGLSPGQPVALTQDQAHYLAGVMRLGEGAAVLLFNGRDGEWLARLGPIGRRGGVAVPEAQTAPQASPPDLWLLFAPIKKARTDFIVEKAVELGVARLLPVQTEFTKSERIRQDRLQAHAREAAEQCGAVVVPEVAPLARLDRVLADWPAGRRLGFCDEALRGAPAGLPEAPAGPWAILIGPEGGFSTTERQKVNGLPFVTQFGLGPRILRADTAAVAALVLWQVRFGDWR